METKIKVHTTSSGFVEVKVELIGSTYSGKYAKGVGENGIVWLFSAS